MHCRLLHVDVVVCEGAVCEIARYVSVSCLLLFCVVKCPVPAIYCIGVCFGSSFTLSSFVCWLMLMFFV